MSHSRSKGPGPNPGRQQRPSTPDYGEAERFGGQGGYGGSQGVYGSQGGYRSINYSDRFGNPGGDSDFQGSEEYRQNQRYGQPQYRSGPSEAGDRQPWGNPDRRRNNVAQFSQRGMQRRATDQWNNESSQQRQSFAGRGPQGYKRSDERIAEDINEELTRDHDVDASNISVEVKDGEVTLNGMVSDRESKRRAEEIAECCSGVQEVMNHLRINRENSSDSGNASRRENPEDKRGKAAG